MSQVVNRKNRYIILILLVITLFSTTLLLAYPAPEVSLDVVSPNGGELWHGDQFILWNSSDIKQVDIWFSGDNGSTWVQIAHNISSLNTLAHQWKWDTTQMDDTVVALINISSRFGYGYNDTQGSGYGGIYNPSLYYDLSDAPFTLDNTPPIVTNISAVPLIQEAGSNVSLFASIKDNVGVASIILSLQFPDSHWENIPLPVHENSGLYWYNRSYRTVGLYSYQSPWQPFAIEDTIPPHVDLIYPVGGETLSGKITILYNITDNSDASFNESISISYSPNGGETWIQAAKALFNTGYYHWNTTTLPDSQTYYIRVNATDHGGNVGWNQTSSSFTLDNSPPQVILTSPTGNTILPDLVTITWNAWDNISRDTNLSITISYSPDNGGNWTSIVNNISNTGLYVHNTQQWSDGNTYLLCVTATDDLGNQGSAISDTLLIKDANPPHVTIARPHEGWLNFRNEQIFPQLTLIIGGFTVQIDAYDYLNITGIGYIDISVDNIIQETLWEKPYQWNWQGTRGKHILTATAYDYAGNHATTSQEIFIITLSPLKVTPDSPLCNS
jgi:hypothetical protein